MSRKVTYVCRSCGSADIDVLCTGWFRPNENWVQGDDALGEVEEFYCNRCDCEQDVLQKVEKPEAA